MPGENPPAFFSLGLNELCDRRRTLWILLGAIFLTSFSLIAFEITLSRLLSVLLSYHYVFIVLSMALLGLGVGGLLVQFLRPKISPEPNRLDILASYALVFSMTIPFSVILLIQGGYIESLRSNILLNCFLLFLPFFFAGMLMAEVFRRFPEFSAKIYGMDLGGAALGSFGVIPLLNILGGISTIFFLGVTASMAPLLLAMAGAWKGKKGRIISIGSFLILSTLLGANFTGFYQPDLPIGENPEKEIHDVLYGPSSQGKIIETRWSAFGRTDLVAFDDKADHMDIYIDGTAGTPMYKFNGDFINLDPTLNSLKESFPGYFPLLYLQEEKDHALIIGPGGGRDVLLALMAGVRKITAVEINKDLVDLVRKFSDYNGGIYKKISHVEIVIDEGRHFLRRQKEKYNLIMLSLPVTNTSRSLEGYALTENFLLTTDSIRDYLDHLTEEGQLIVVGHNDAEILRLLSISLIALGQRHISLTTAMRQIYILGSDLYPVFVLKKTPFEPEEIFHRFKAIDQFGLKPVSSYFPYLRQTKALNPALMRLGSGEIGLDDLKNMVKERGYDISLVTDNRPFFYKIERGVPGSVSLVFWSSMLIWLLIVLVPLIYWKRGLIQPETHFENRKYFSQNRLKSIALFSLLGVGFMLIEISFIQRFALFLGQPVFPLAVLLFSLLGWAGMGSFWSGRFASDKIDRGVAISSLSIVIVILVYTFLLPYLLDRLLGLDLFLRLLATILILAPLGFAMGFPFPLGMRLLREKKMEYHIPWMWGINGAGSVLGSVMTIIIAISFGFTEALLASAACYFIVFIIFLKS